MTNKLKVTAQGEREIVMTRVLDAPRDLVFDAWTQADLLRRCSGVRMNGLWRPARAIRGSVARFAWYGVTPTGKKWG